ncbi:hypothetical protein J2W40_000601 [Sphingobium xenophagum]|uniref:Cardiolipin synthase N-terminal domain-containing protein n=1 Tax=Sphingobium xenophagum TaxID=121428 RepID=A0ABU1WXK2_SPHXE|nr:hypothetical protein [Sphingobium xenophagum]
MIDWIVATIFETIWDALAQLARRIGGKGCFWAAILLPVAVLCIFYLLIAIAAPGAPSGS